MKKLLCLALPLLLAACATAPSAPDNKVASDFQRPAQGAYLLMLPPKDAGEFEKGNDILKKQLHSQLRAAGYRVAMLDPNNYEALWSEEAAAVGGLYDPASGDLRPDAYAQAFASLIRRVSGETKAVMILQPRLAARTARLTGSKAQWDGQERLVPSAGAGSSYTYSGTDLAISVELSAYTPQGGLAFRMYGGASLPYRANYVHEENELRKDLFDDDKEFAEGVALAIAPLAGKRQ